MEPKGYEKKPWFPYFRNMYEEIGENMMAVDAKGYEEKPWWPYVLDLQEKIEEGGGGGSSDFSTAEVTMVNNATDPISTNMVATMSGPFGTIFVKNKGINTGSGVYNVVLYNNIQEVEMYDYNLFTVSVDGDLEYEEGILTVRGNGTVTIGAK